MKLKKNQKKALLIISVIIGIFLIWYFGFREMSVTTMPLKEYCDTYGKCIGNTLYYCDDKVTVGQIVYPELPPNAVNTYRCDTDKDKSYCFFDSQCYSNDCNWLFKCNPYTLTIGDIKACENWECSIKQLDITCTDSDNGKNYKVRGEVVRKINGNPGFPGEFLDKCSISGKLIEYFCENNVPTMISTNCYNSWGILGGTCINGACVDSDTCPEGQELCRGACIPIGTCEDCPEGYIYKDGYCQLPSETCQIKSGKPEDCGGSNYDTNLCDKEECESCGFFFTPGTIFGDYSGTCTKDKPSETCQTCDDYAFSYLLGKIFKSKSCDAKGWTLEWSFFFVSPPQGEKRCFLSFAKLLLTPIIFIFSLLFGLDYLTRFKDLKGKKRNVLRFLIALSIAGLLAYLVYIIFVVGLMLFIIFIIIKIGIKSIL